MASFKPLAFALFLVPACMAAQDATAPEFHAGQWALQFGGNLDLATFGIMRFSGPRSALVLNLDVAGQFLKGTLIQSSVGVSDANDCWLRPGAPTGFLRTSASAAQGLSRRRISTAIRRRPGAEVPANSSSTES